MASLKKKSYRNILITCLLILAILLSATGLITQGLHALGLGKLSRSNEAYLQKSFRHSLSTFAVLSAIKVGLAVVEGTEIGIGFGIPIGDAVTAAYDYVDLAWRTVLLSSAVLLGTQYILQMADLASKWFLVCTLACILLMHIARWFFGKYHGIRRSLRDICLLLTVLTISLYILLPLSVTGGRFLSERITAPSLQESEEGFSHLKTDLFPDADTRQSGLFSKINTAKDKLKQIIAYLSMKTTELSLWVLKMIAGYIFDTLVFPLVLFVFLVWFTRLTARYLFQIRRQQTLKEDLESIMTKVYSRPIFPQNN
ncbi:hypothetical protein ACFL6A_00740 [bacterium]